jgi:hypothetical protein
MTKFLFNPYSRQQKLIVIATERSDEESLEEISHCIRNDIAICNLIKFLHI